MTDNDLYALFKTSGLCVVRNRDPIMCKFPQVHEDDVEAVSQLVKLLLGAEATDYKSRCSFSHTLATADRSVYILWKPRKDAKYQLNFDRITQLLNKGAT